MRTQDAADDVAYLQKDEGGEPEHEPADVWTVRDADGERDRAEKEYRWRQDGYLEP